MDSQELKDTTRRWLSGIFTECKYDLIGEMASENWLFRLNGLEPFGASEYPAVHQTFKTAFPDLDNTIEEQVVEDNVVVTRGTSRGTHKAPLGKIPATGKKVEIPWVVFTRFEGGKIVEDRELYDEYGMMKQLGIVVESE